jgi:hypothetical protein
MAVALSKGKSNTELNLDIRIVDLVDRWSKYKA